MIGDVPGGMWMHIFGRITLHLPIPYQSNMKVGNHKKCLGNRCQVHSISWQGTKLPTSGWLEVNSLKHGGTLGLALRSLDFFAKRVFWVLFAERPWRQNPCLSTSNLAAIKSTQGESY